MNPCRCLIKARGYEVLGAHHGTDSPAFTTTTYRVGAGEEKHWVKKYVIFSLSLRAFSQQIGNNSDAVAAQRQFLQIADVVIYELLSNEPAARDAAVQMAQQPVSVSVACTAACR